MVFKKFIVIFRTIWGFLGLLVIPICAYDNIDTHIFTTIVIVWAAVFFFTPHQPRKDWK